jgi:hypothetical protein
MIEKSKYEKPEKRIQKSDKSDLKGEKNIAVLLERLDRYRTIVDHLLFANLQLFAWRRDLICQ